MRSQELSPSTEAQLLQSPYPRPLAVWRSELGMNPTWFLRVAPGCVLLSNASAHTVSGRSLHCQHDVPQASDRLSPCPCSLNAVADWALCDGLRWVQRNVLLWAKCCGALIISFLIQTSSHLSHSLFLLVLKQTNKTLLWYVIQRFINGK